MLKGPQTTYFGANATAGAFSLITRKPVPGDPVSADFSALWDPDDDEYNLEAAASISLTEELALRVAGKFYSMEGYMDNEFLHNDEPDIDGLYAVRASFAWEPVENYRMDFRFESADSDKDGAFSYEVEGCPPGKYALPPPGPINPCQLLLAQSGAPFDNDLDWEQVASPNFFKRDSREYALTNQWTIGEYALTAVTTYYDHDFETLATPIPLPVTPVGNSAGNAPGQLLMGGRLEDFDQFTQELRLESNIGDSIDYMLGVYYLRSDLDSVIAVNLSFIPPLPRNTGFVSGLEQDMTTISGFGSADLHITEQLRLSLGLRYSSVSKDADRVEQVGQFAQLPPHVATFVRFPPALEPALAGALGRSLAPYADDDRTDDGFMPSIAVEYDLTPSTMLYVSYTEGFKAGGFSVSGTPDTFEEEEVISFEAGLKARLLDDTMLLNLAAYYTEYDDLQETLNRNNPVTGNVELFVGNVGKTRSQGVDLEVFWRPIEGLALHANVGFLDAEYDEFKNAPCDDIVEALTVAGDCLADLSGHTRQFSPRWSGRIGAEYQVPLGTGVLSFSPSLDFSTDFYTLASLDPLSEQTDYTKLNLRIAYTAEEGRWEVALLGRNLTDKFTSNFRNGMPTAPGTVYLLPDRPRSVALQFSMRY